MQIPRCPSSGECIYKLWLIHTMGYYSSIKRNFLHRQQYGWIPKTLFGMKEARPKWLYTARFNLYEILEKLEPWCQKVDWWFTGARGVGFTNKEHKGTFWSSKSCFLLWFQNFTFLLKTHWIVPFKLVNLMWIMP